LLPVVEGEVEKKVEYDELRAEINKVLFNLPYRQREVIKIRFGLGDEEPKTLEEIGEIFNVSKERIRQIERNAMSRLKYYSRKGNLKSFWKDYQILP